MEAVERAEKGLIDADLGAGVIKQRLARQGQGKSGGFRVAIFFRSGDRTVFVHGFAKKDRANLSKQEEKQLKALSKIVLNLTEEELNTLVKAGKYVEVKRKKE